MVDRPLGLHRKAVVNTVTVTVPVPIAWLVAFLGSDTCGDGGGRTKTWVTHRAEAADMLDPSELLGVECAAQNDVAVLTKKEHLELATSTILATSQRPIS